MKKFIVAIDGLQYSESTVQYAITLAQQSNAHLTGIFLDDFTYHSYKIYELIGDNGVEEERREALEKIDIEKRLQAVKNFRENCEEAGIHFNVHSDKSFAIQELLHESIYADLLIIDGKETFMHYQENQPTRFVRGLLAHVQCPVLVVPSQFQQIEKIVFLYDGNPSSVYAIRTFSYLLPFLRKLEIEVITVQTGHDQLYLPDKRLMREFMDRHFPTATYKLLRGVPETLIAEQLGSEKENTMVVLGAYRRGLMSRWFRPSMADVLMEKLRIPLFIAHN